MPKAAVIQMRSLCDIKDNAHQAILAIKKAKSMGAELVVLPENFLTFGQKNLYELALSEDFTQALALLFSVIKEQQLHAVLGTVPVIAEDSEELDREELSRVYAQSMWVAPDGAVLGFYNKMHLFDYSKDASLEVYSESSSFIPGKYPVSLNLNMKGVKPFEAMLSVCYDLRFPEYYRKLVNSNTRLLVVPSAFTYSTGQAHWEILLKARAVENQVYVLAANQGGAHENQRETWGHSMIISPWGEILGEVLQTALTAEGVGVICADLDFDKQDQIRTEMPSLSHRKL